LISSLFQKTVKYCFVHINCKHRNTFNVCTFFYFSFYQNFVFSKTSWKQLSLFVFSFVLRTCYYFFFIWMKNLLFFCFVFLSFVWSTCSSYSSVIVILMLNRRSIWFLHKCIYMSLCCNMSQLSGFYILKGKANKGSCQMPSDLSLILLTFAWMFVFIICFFTYVLTFVVVFNVCYKSSQVLVLLCNIYSCTGYK